MLVGASYTLFRMRKNLGIGMRRAVADLKKSAAAHEATSRTAARPEQPRRSSRGLGVVFVCMIALYYYFCRGDSAGAVVAARGDDRAGVLLRGRIGQPGGHDRLVEQPGLGPDAVHAGDRGAADGFPRRLAATRGVAAVLGVAAVVCVSSAVAGEMLQDLKVGHILGGTPAKMQIGDLLGIVVASLVLFFPLMWLHRAYTFGSPATARAASRSDGLAGAGHRGRQHGVAAGGGGHLHGVRADPGGSEEPHAVLGGHVPAAGNHFRHFRRRHLPLADGQVSATRRGFNDAQKARIENAGVLTAAGLIAGEALCGLLVAGFRAAEKSKGHAILPDATWAGSSWLSILVLIALAALMIRLPLANAGRPDQPAPPTAIM